MKKKSKLFKNIKTTALILFCVSLVLLLFSVKRFLVEIFLFVFCLIFMIRFGQFFILDVDPVPFCAILLMHLFDFQAALNFVFLTLPIVDVVSGRFSHFTFINFISILASILVLALLPVSALLLGIPIFNLFRTALALFFGLGPQMIGYNLVHMVIYFMVGSVLSFFM
ncbi:MAG: hypothetical protein ABIJ34_02135 [archaeon]